MLYENRIRTNHGFFKMYGYCCLWKFLLAYYWNAETSFSASLYTDKVLVAETSATTDFSIRVILANITSRDVRIAVIATAMSEAYNRNMFVMLDEKPSRCLNHGRIHMLCCDWCSVKPSSNHMLIYSFLWACKKVDNVWRLDCQHHILLLWDNWKRLLYRSNDENVSRWELSRRSVIKHWIELMSCHWEHAVCNMCMFMVEHWLVLELQQCRLLLCCTARVSKWCALFCPGFLPRMLLLTSTPIPPPTPPPTPPLNILLKSSVEQLNTFNLVFAFWGIGSNFQTSKFEWSALISSSFLLNTEPLKLGEHFDNPDWLV